MDPNQDLIGFEFKSEGVTWRVVATWPANPSYVEVTPIREDNPGLRSVRVAKQVRRAKELRGIDH